MWILYEFQLVEGRPHDPGNYTGDYRRNKTMHQVQEEGGVVAQAWKSSVSLVFQEIQPVGEENGEARRSNGSTEAKSCSCRAQCASSIDRKRAKLDLERNRHRIVIQLFRILFRYQRELTTVSVESGKNKSS